MEIMHIREFVRLAENCSFQDTANELYVSQSSLTKHIKSIESELGVQLFTRTTRKVTLNKYGKVFYQYAKQIADLSDDYTSAMRYMVDQANTHLNIGAVGFMNSFGLYRTLAQFKVAYPDIKYVVVEEKDAELKRRMAADELSLVFTPNIQQYPEFEHCFWKSDDIVLIVHKSHPFADLQSISVEQLRNEEIIIHGPPSDYSEFYNACNNCGFTPYIHTTISYSTTIVSLVSNNQGISVINRCMLSDVDKSQISVIPIVPRIVSNVYAVYSPSRLLSDADKALLSFIANSNTFQ